MESRPSEDLTKSTPARPEDTLPVDSTAPETESDDSASPASDAPAEPAIRLAIEGRRNDGWYEIGQVEVTE